MSRSNLWQICHKNARGNNHLTKHLVEIIREQCLTSKQIAYELFLPTERVRNWYYKGTGMTALDLLLLMSEYEFVRDFIEKAVIAYVMYKDDRAGN